MYLLYFRLVVVVVGSYSSSPWLDYIINFRPSYHKQYNNVSGRATRKDNIIPFWKNLALYNQ